MRYSRGHLAALYPEAKPPVGEVVGRLPKFWVNHGSIVSTTAGFSEALVTATTDAFRTAVQPLTLSGPDNVLGMISFDRHTPANCRGKQLAAMKQARDLTQPWG